MEITQVLIHIIETEKSVNLQSKNQYTFKVHKDANKIEIRQAVEKMFGGIHVVDVTTATMHGKKRTFRSKRGMRVSEATPWKKAVVTLAPGETIAELQG